MTRLAHDVMVAVGSSMTGRRRDVDGEQPVDDVRRYNNDNNNNSKQWTMLGE